jgi:DNA polymerase-3 subunit delta
MQDIFNKKDISISLYKLLELGEDEFSILRAIEYFINQLFLFNTYRKLNGSIDSMAILGYRLPKHIESQRANMAIKIKSNTILKIYEYLLYSELKLKETKAIDREALIFSILIKIQSYL